MLQHTVKLLPAFQHFADVLLHNISNVCQLLVYLGFVLLGAGIRVFLL
jgi:hypothetical protein